MQKNEERRVCEMSSLSKKPRGQMSDSFLMAAFIIMSGGLQDAYTYCCRDKVFANAQTGNIVLMSTHLFAGDWPGVSRYFVPVLSFMAGIFVAECVHRRYKRMEKVHWRQIIILAEIVLLFVVGFLPQEVNTFANALVSFVCAMQVQTFRKVRGHAYKKILQKSMTYFAVIGVFALGAGCGSVLTARYAEKGIWVSCILLTISFLMMFVREDVEKA